ncbi:MAG: hypothetical protein K9M44_02190 [Candidatus Pacebacteria bacterium]|nr:hypothetical protein [Candidatus Paceibacterota bacterium]
MKKNLILSLALIAFSLAFLVVGLKVEASSLSLKTSSLNPTNDYQGWIIDGDNMVSVVPGNIGIGKKDPLFKLDVKGKIGLNGKQILFSPELSENTLYVGNGGSNITSNSHMGTYVGFESGANIVSGNSNTSLGYRSLYSTTAASGNTAIGASALENNTTGLHNAAVGGGSLNKIEEGHANTAVGTASLFNVLGSRNVALGGQAGYGQANTDINDNVLIGFMTGYSLGTGADNNVLIGSLVAESLVSGNNNIIIGWNLDAMAVDASYDLNIGDVLFGDLLTGNISIGTTDTSTFKLDVNGNSRINGLLSVATPIIGNNATTKDYVDSVCAANLKKVSQSFSLTDKNGKDCTMTFVKGFLVESDCLVK